MANQASNNGNEFHHLWDAAKKKKMEIVVRLVSGGNLRVDIRTQAMKTIDYEQVKKTQSVEQAAGVLHKRLIKEKILGA